MLAAIVAGSALGWARVSNGLRARGWPLWLRMAGGLLAVPVGGFGGFLAAGSLTGTLDTHVRWAFAILGAMVLACVFLAGRRPHRSGNSQPRSHAAAQSDMLPRLANVAVGIREQWRAAMADAEKKRAAAKAPPKPAPTLPATFAFNYRDADDVFTERVVKVYSVEEMGRVVYLTGYCDLRKAERTFRSDRISGWLRLIYTPHTYTAEEVSRYHLAGATPPE